ncbi:MAG TPA: hypothetical protein VK577_06915, partial [Bradyrhizobium sp.]|nr:hypothetical protein [Bradyrhizobium sp.]
EAQEGLALQQKDAEAAKQRSWADTGRSVLSAPYRLAKGLASAPPQAPVAPGELPEADALLKQDPIANVLSNVGGAIKSGFTAPGDVKSGEIPEYADGHTSPEMVHRAFDTSAMAGGASFGGKAAAAPVVAADSAKAALPVAAAERAPPFYSALEHAVAEHPQEVAPAKQWLGTLSNKPGVKPDELKYTGTADMLAKKGDQPVTKAELQDHLEQNKVQLGEVMKGGEYPAWEKLTPEEQYDFRDRYHELEPESRAEYSGPRDFYEQYTHENPDEVPGAARYAGYQLPGGENYREKLLTYAPPGFADAEAARDAGHPVYQSSHWDEPNVLAHLRMNDRDVTGNGFVVRNQVSGNASQHFPDHATANAYIEKLPENIQRQVNIVPAREAKPSLHLEEIQSDWHQTGREKGYGQGLKPGWRYNTLEDGGIAVHGPDRAAPPYGIGANPAEAERVARHFGGLETGGVPDAPFKKNWHELALKRALHEAAETGKDRISWTPGEAQAARYDLSTQLHRLEWNRNPDGTYDLKGVGRSQTAVQRSTSIGDNIPEAKLPDYVGKEMAERIANEKANYKKYEGVDLKVGGQGMKGFYDKIIPEYLDKIGKPHGVKVGRGHLPESSYSLVDEEGKPGQSFSDRAQGEAWLRRNPVAAKFWSLKETPHPVHYMDIPPSLKQQLLTKGMPLFEDNAAAAPIAAAAHAGEANVERAAAIPRGAPGAGGGAGSLEEAQRASARAAGAVQPLAGLPQKPIVLNGEHYIPGPIGAVHDVAKQYMEHTGRPYERAEAYRPLDVEHSTAIAKAFDEMKHEPSNPRVKASYEALAKETGDQYRAIKKSGLKVEPIGPDMPDPYAANPRLAAKDVAENNHLWFFPTEGGFGAEKGAASAEHPMLQPSGEMLNGKPLLNNDLFRIVHDYFGHLKEGNGFRAAGEDNAWRTHSKMYSEAARPAMTTETRGQNSWVNYGPHGEHNRTASAADTHFSEQKVGLMPDWTMRDREPIKELERAAGVDPNTAPHPGAKYPQYAEQYPPVGPPQLMDKATGKPLPAKGKAAQKLVDQGKAYWGKQLTPEAQAFQKDRGSIQKELETKGYDPFFPPEERSHVDPANYPTPLDMTKDALPAKQATVDKYHAMFSTPEATERLQKAFDVGRAIPGADNWYAMRQLEQQYIKHLGPEEGRKRFADEFAHTMAATTGGADPTSNLLLAHYVQWAQKNHGAIPEASHELPFPIGGRYVSGNIDQFRKMPEGGFTENNPKRHDFAHAFLGHANKATMDEQMSGGLVPGMQKPPGDSYGVAAQVVHDLAAKNGVHPRDFQDVAWAGLKKLKTEEAGKKFSYKGPMITDVNDAIERTHRLTGMPRNEVVKRGLVKKEIPLYAGGVPMGSLNPQDDQ